MTIKLYNTLTRKKEVFKPINEKQLKMYVCGVTVYDDVHIGHAASYIYYDILLNYFKHFHNYDILYVRNITDVGHLTDDQDAGEDKVEKRARERKKHPMELVYTYTHRMWKSFDLLKLTRPNLEPFASGHILEMQEWIKKMLENGYAYNANGNIYFDITKFKEYGKFSKKNIEDLEKNTRFTNDPNKKNVSDFALWIKAAKNHILKWPSPWGEGYPGWHLECSVMGCKYLGDHFDIHGGGVEHVFPHHQNEIAQNYGYFEHKVVNYWVHSALLTVNGKKMGKSLGNSITIENFLKDHSAESLRYLISSGHYRKPQNYTDQSIVDAEKTLEKLNIFIKRIQNINSNKENETAQQIIDTSINNFTKAMDDDLNTSGAWAEIHFMIKEINKALENKGISTKQSEQILDFLKKINLVFKVFCFKVFNKNNECTDKQENTNAKIPKKEIEQLIQERKKLRDNKKWEASDAIRDKLKEKGIILFDGKNETTWAYE